MDPIYIPQLTTAPEQTETINFEEFISELETLTPVRGIMLVKHQGNYLDIHAKADTIINLTCHRCLQQYNHRLTVDTSELIWLQETVEQAHLIPLERETSLEELVETLSPNGYFNCKDWLYEQLCLAMPPRQLCDLNCSGILGKNSSESASHITSDRRWASLEQLKKKFPN